ncbi:MAG: hypothetical protein ACI867_000682 [Glaciecola sp.]
MARDCTGCLDSPLDVDLWQHSRPADRVERPMQTWLFDFDARYERTLAVFGIRTENSRVELHPDSLVVHFGRWSLATPWTNVKRTQMTREYTAIKAIGARGSLRDRGVTFGSNIREGLCICFIEPVPSLLGPIAGHLFKHPGMTITVQDCEGLQAEVQRRLTA